MLNPFGETEDEEGDVEILEGFLCPICREDLKSVEFLTEHFERAHAEQEDILKSLFKDIFSKAMKKINLNFDDSSDLSRNFQKQNTITSTCTTINNSRSHMNVYNFLIYQEIGIERSHMEYFQSIRNPRLEHYAAETNKLIIRLHKLLKDMPIDPIQRKQHEQKIVSWLDGSSVKLCPSCAKSFHLTRRQHHCRLCGSILCQECSKFLGIASALKLTNIINTNNTENVKYNDEKKDTASSIVEEQKPSIRCCDHCLRLLETRQDMHESRTCRPLIAELYAEIQQIRKNITPDTEMYLKVINSLYEGESMFTLNDASALRGKIGKIAETIDILSKRILAIPCHDGTREERLKKAIRLSCIHFIKDKMLSLPSLPKDEDIRRIYERKRMETEQRIAMERRLAMEAYERYETDISCQNTVQKTKHAENYTAQGSDLHSLDNWSAHQVNTSGRTLSDDPLVEQINIIKSYIKQARQDMNFEVVETLEMNLRELQKEYYERQRSTMQVEEGKSSEEKRSNQRY